MAESVELLALIQNILDRLFSPPHSPGPPRPPNAQLHQLQPRWSCLAHPGSFERVPTGVLMREAATPYKVT